MDKCQILSALHGRAVTSAMARIERGDPRFRFKQWAEPLGEETGWRRPLNCMVLLSFRPLPPWLMCSARAPAQTRRPDQVWWLGESHRVCSGGDDQACSH